MDPSKHILVCRSTINNPKTDLSIRNPPPTPSHENMKKKYKWSHYFFLNYINYLYNFFSEAPLYTRNRVFWTLEVVTIPSSKWRSSRSLVLTFTLRQRSVYYHIQNMSTSAKLWGFFNTNQHFPISTQFQAARGRSFESCLWIWIFFDRISKQNVPLRNKFLSFDQEMILSINLTAQSQWICLRLVGLFFTPHALKASEFFSYIYIVKEKKMGLFSTSQTNI